jgi:flagellar hook assembly protein FlgD
MRPHPRSVPEAPIVRRVAAGILAGLLLFALAWTGSPEPAAAVVSSDPKVVLVVGATHGTTSQYRSYMNVVAATAARYSRNVVKVYSPNATWSAVRTALKGASIVVYMGHGNGFPSPYSTTPNPYTQNGMGLNLTAGAGDSNTKYYGEHYFAADVDLAPNAVVILSHNCYASGNSEPGRAEPSLAVAKARIDNFAAGFLRAGARAVIADGHSDPSWYVEQLFTTHRTVEQIWRSGPRPHGNTFTFASVRTPGYTAFSDPDHRSGSTITGFYRSLVAKPTLTSDQVTGARHARTDAHPGFFVVPGAAAVTAVEGVGLYPDATLTPDPGTGLAPATLPLGTRLRVRAAAGTSPAGAAIYDVATLDGATSGFVAAAGLVPRDSASPVIFELDPGTGTVSPAAGSTTAITARASEAVSWHVEVRAQDGSAVATMAAEGEELATSWDGRTDGAAAPEGAYEVVVTAYDGWGNPPATASTVVIVDVTPPTLSSVAVMGGVATFSPNGDGAGDTARFAFHMSEPGLIFGTVRDANGEKTTTFSGQAAATSGTVSWDGRRADGSYVPDGVYSVALSPRDVAGNVGSSVGTSVAVYTALSRVKAASYAFWPNDRDAYASRMWLAFELDTAARVTWTLSDPAGATVMTFLDDVESPTGRYAIPWDGRLPGGRFATAGIYTSRVVVTDGTLVGSGAARFHVNAFRLSLSTSSPSRGGAVTATIVATEPMKANPSITVSQPGVASYTVRTVKTSTYGYRATFRLSRGGSAGTLTLTVKGYDARGGYNWSRFAFPLR